MGLRPFQCLAFVLVLALLFCSGTEQKAEANDASQELSEIQIPEKNSHKLLFAATKLESSYDMPQMDVSTPLATVPVVNPSNSNPNPTVTTPTYPSNTPTAMPLTPNAPMLTPNTPMPPSSTSPSMVPPTTPSTGGKSWCIASQSASPTPLQVALDYACGYGGADCSAIQPGGSCFNPDTVRDHASYAFNNYYQKNPVPTSCDFGGTAVLTSVDPSTSSCLYPSTSTGTSVLNTTTPATTPNVYGSSPPVYGSTSPPDYGDNNAATMPKSTTILSLMCLLIATISLNIYK